MAKGNDGNLLQHAVELGLGDILSRERSGRRLHLVHTHAMAPYEAFGEDRGGLRGALDAVLDRSRGSTIGSDPVLVRAYRACSANDQHFPNTAEVLAAIVHREALSGVLVDRDDGKLQELEATWAASDVAVTPGSWRAAAGDEGALRAACDLSRPWLFTMDPMKYLADGDGDDEYLHPGDLTLALELLSGYFATGLPGAAAIFSYSMQPPERRAFREATSEVLDSLRIPLVRIAIRARGGNFHEGVVVLNSERLRANLRRRVEALRRLGAEWHWDP